jgi:TRAP-type transport system small permease protein
MIDHPAVSRRGLRRATIAALCGGLAGVFVTAMVLLTVADVVLRAIVNRPIRGSYELIELFLTCSFFFALPATFLRDEHIVVDVIDGIAPAQVPLLKRIAEVVAVGTLGVMAWQSWLVAADAVAFGDITSDLALPRILYWIPVLAGLVGSAIAALVMALRRDRDR